MEGLTEFSDTYNEILTINEQIKTLENNREKYFQSLDKLISQWLIAYNWKPYYNEKAVNIALDGQVAWHLWFLEISGDCFRFREVPNDFPHIHNYYRQEIVPTDQNVRHGWIVPMSLFQELNKILSFNLYPEKHMNYKL